MTADALTTERDAASTWRRLRYTPLRDLLRGRLSGRLDIDAVIAAADLPTSLANLVRKTARRTRLWRIEKVDVARELTAHFQDGLEAGTTADELAARFGHPRRAARLIGRAKRRNRPVAWKALGLCTRALLAFFALVFLTAIGLTARMHLGEVRLSRNYVAELNAPIRAIPEEDRAWPLYQEAFQLLGELPGHDRLKPGDENWPALVACAQQHAEAIELLHAAAQKPRYGRVYTTATDLPQDRTAAGAGDRADDERAGRSAGDKPPFIGLSLPGLGPLRQAAKLMTIDAHIAAQAGDGERACRDLETIFQFAEHTSESPFLISDLVALAILGLNMDSIGTILRDHPDLFSDRQLVELSHRLAGVCGGGRLRVRFTSERWTFHDIIQRLYTDDRHGNGHLTEDAPELFASLTADRALPRTRWVLAPLLGALVAGRREMLRKYDELMSATEAEAQLPLWERGESAAEREISRMSSTPLERLRYLPVVILMPSLQRASVIAELATQQRDATLTAMACELYRRHTGAWPASLSEPTPRYLPAAPLDRFNGQPLRYQLVDGSPLIHSIGMDLDNDNGRLPDGKDPDEANRKAREWHPPKVIEAMKVTSSPELADGDWILWPPID
jgi:hypothetical protein